LIAGELIDMVNFRLLHSLQGKPRVAPRFFPIHIANSITNTISIAISNERNSSIAPWKEPDAHEAKATDDSVPEDSEHLESWKLFIVIGSLGLAIFLLGLDTNIVGVAMPEITTEFSSLEDISCLLSAHGHCIPTTLWEPLHIFCRQARLPSIDYLRSRSFVRHSDTRSLHSWTWSS
jgi:hypothetical protein